MSNFGLPELSPYRHNIIQPIYIAHELPRHATKSYDLRKFQDIKRIVVHTTDWDTTPQEVARYDVGPNHVSATGCPAITYHEIIMKDGKAYQTLDFEEISWHAGPWNKGSLALAMMYRVSDKEGKDTYAPTEEQLWATVYRCGSLCLDLNITPDNVVGHRELSNTGWFWSKGSKVLRKTCPGMQVDLDLLRERVTGYIQIHLRQAGIYDGELNGIFDQWTKEAFDAWLVRK